jgi:hypothetical protein
MNCALYIHFIKGVMLGFEMVEEETKMLVFDFLIVRLILEYE